MKIKIPRPKIVKAPKGFFLPRENTATHMYERHERVIAFELFPEPIEGDKPIRYRLRPWPVTALGTVSAEFMQGPDGCVTGLLDQAPYTIDEINAPDAVERRRTTAERGRAAFVPIDADW